MPSARLTARMVFATALGCLTLSSPTAAKTAAKEKSGEPLSVKVTPRVTLVGGGVLTTVRVVRAPENRLLSIAVDGPAYYSSTDVQLDGDQAAQTHTFRWLSLPAGQYVVQVLVERSDRRVLEVSGSFEVVGQPQNPAAP